VLNALTLPFVLMKRIAEGGEFLRLNAANLNVNSTGLLYGVAFCALVVDRPREHAKRAAPQGTDPDQGESRREQAPSNRGNQRWHTVLLVLFGAIVLLSGSRTALLLLVAPLLTRSTLRWLNLRNALLAAVLLITAAFAFSRRISEGEDLGTATLPSDLEGTAAEDLSIVGRAWSLLVGVDVLSETRFAGTQSVEEAITRFQEGGVHSFAHSTMLMLVILYGVLGVLFCAICAWFVCRLTAAVSVRVTFVLLLLVSGGLITNPKEIALMFLAPLLLFAGHEQPGSPGILRT